MRMNFKSALVAFCALLTLATGVASARRFESHIYFQNKSDAHVWVTAYTMDHRALSPWCIDPGKYDKHGVFQRILEVRAEVSRVGCYRTPVLLNELRAYPHDLPAGDGTVFHVLQYYVQSTNGTYVYNAYP
jgi:hypothetical protein